jgi:hypothetical protein
VTHNKMFSEKIRDLPAFLLEKFRNRTAFLKVVIARFLVFYEVSRTKVFVDRHSSKCSCTKVIVESWYAHKCAPRVQPMPVHNGKGYRL